MGSILCGCFGGDCQNESKDDTDGGKGSQNNIFVKHFNWPAVPVKMLAFVP